MKSLLKKAAAMAIAIGCLTPAAFSQQREFKRTVHTSNNKTVQVTETPPGTMTVLPGDIVEYLESNGIASFYNDTYSHFSKANLVELQKHKDGKRKFYPLNEVKNALHSMQRRLEASYHYNGHLTIEEGKGADYNVFYELMDIAVLLCKDINHLSGTCSSDHKVGILDFAPGYEGIFFHSIICNTGNGTFKAHTLDLVENTMPLEVIRKISETEKKTTYIASIESTSHVDDFTVYVIDIHKDGTITSCKPVNSKDAIGYWWSADAYNKHDDMEIIYNPKKVCWELCVPKGDIYKKIDGTKSLCLEFNEGAPVFTIQ